MKIILLLLTVSCIAKEIPVSAYVKETEKKLQQWIEDPTESHYNSLHFYIHANKPATPVTKTQEKIFDNIFKKYDSVYNPQCLRCFLVQEIAFGAMELAPQCAPLICYLNLFATGAIIGKGTHLSPENVLNTLKHDLKKIINESRTKKIFPHALSMEKNEGL